MNRLQTEFHRLYLSHAPEGNSTVAEASGLIGPDGRVRAMVLELARPADWSALAAVWRGVQADLALPAPAIAVNGIDGYQLWFSLSEAVPVAQAEAFLAALRQRYLPGIASGRIRLLPDAPTETAPPRQEAGDRWSAFVLADLAAVFADDPWMDLPPPPQTQAELLSRVDVTPLAAFYQALEQLGPVEPPILAPAVSSDPAAADAASQRPAPASPTLDAKRFLLSVMNDPAVELRLRIEAAKALLPGFEEPRRG